MANAAVKLLCTTHLELVCGNLRMHNKRLQFWFKLSQSQTELVIALYFLFLAVFPLLCSGKRVSDVAEKLAACVEPFDCQLVEGVMTHQMKQFVIDGNKVVLNRSSPETKVDDAEFEPNEVYAVDIVVSTGEGARAGVEGAGTERDGGGAGKGLRGWGMEPNEVYAVDILVSTGEGAGAGVEGGQEGRPGRGREEVEEC